MYFVFADDSKQQDPSREGMGGIVGFGGIVVLDDVLKTLEERIDEICLTHGFPKGDPTRAEFKWSPDKDKHWMYQGLKGSKREAFFQDVIKVLAEARVCAIVVAVDKKHSRATKAKDHEEEAFIMFWERVQKYAESTHSSYIMVTDQPGGGPKENNRFLKRCKLIQSAGTRYVTMDDIALNVLCCPTKFVRLLQAADLVVGSTVARVAGEDKHSPRIFESVRGILRQESGKTAGIGLKVWSSIETAIYQELLGGAECAVESNQGNDAFADF